LPSDEAEHLVRVLRLGAGAEVEVFDGKGTVWRAEVVQADKKSVAVRPIDVVQAAPEPHVDLTLAIAVLKGDKMDDVVRDAVMLGVARVQPVVSARTEVSLAALARGHRVERWQRVAVSSAKQCRRAVVPPVLEPVPLDRVCTHAAPGLRVICVEPSATHEPVTPPQRVPRPDAATVIVGPEGGWTGTEVATAERSGAILMSLGPRTLRADAVPIVAVTALLTTWGELS
jgi:16S rRNA (uracil1498-N3)-methyltransferase